MNPPTIVTDTDNKATIIKLPMDNNTTINKSSTTTQQQLHSRTSALGNAFGLLLATIALLVMSLILLITGEHRSPTDHITKPTTAPENVAYCTNQAHATWDANIYNNNRTAIADMGASQHYLHGKAPISNFNANGTPTLVNTANGQSIQSTGQAKLLLPNLPPGSKDCHIMPSFTNNLLSLGKFCNAGCTVIFTDTNVKVIDKTGAIILQVHQDKQGPKCGDSTSIQTTCQRKPTLQQPQHKITSTPIYTSSRLTLNHKVSDCPCQMHCSL